MSSFPRNIGCPPIVTTAPSVDILVLVLRLLNAIATTFPANEPKRDFGIDPDFIVRLCEEALRTSVVNSDGVRSAIERKCLGVRGKVGGGESDEYLCNCALPRLRRAFVVHRVGSILDGLWPTIEVASISVEMLMA